jgi:hypothetical protein
MDDKKIHISGAKLDAYIGVPINRACGSKILGASTLNRAFGRSHK